LNFKKHYPKQNKIFKILLWVLIAIALALFIQAIVYKNNYLLNKTYVLFYTKAIILLTLWGFYLVIKVKEKVKYYIICGSFFLFLSFLLTIIIIDFNVITKNHDIGFLIFYIGILLENLCFSLALGFKQKIIAQEKEQVQQNFIKKLKENKTLKEIS